MLRRLGAGEEAHRRLLPGRDAGQRVEGLQFRLVAGAGWPAAVQAQQVADPLVIVAGLEDGVGEGHGNAPSQQMTNPIADRPAALDSFVSIVQPGKEQAGQLAARDTFKSTLPFRQAARSEEHTSELQSLMRISNAV